jgi:hypothetical protein
MTEGPGEHIDGLAEATDKVGRRARADALAAFRYRPSTPTPEDPERPTWICPICSALVEDRERHVRWHKTIAGSMVKADYAYQGARRLA